MAQRNEPIPQPPERRQPYESVSGGGGTARVREVAQPAGERSMADIIKDIVANLQEIMRSEINLARAEMTQKATTAGRAAIIAVVGAVVGLYAVGFLLAFIFNALALVMPFWASALIVGAVLAIAAGIMLSVGIQRLKKLSPKPTETIRSIREDVQWLKNQTR